jgi:hypothetical protein
MRREVSGQGNFLCRRELARPVATPPADAGFTGAPPTDQRFVEISDTLTRNSLAAANRRQNPPPLVL